MTAIPSVSPVRAVRSDRPLVVAAALAAAVIVFAGFARTFYLKGLFGTPPLSNLLFVHGVVMTLWIALVIGQVALVAGNRRDLHRRLGVAGGALAVLIIAIGATVALEAGRRGFTPTPQVTPLAFMAIPLADLVVFGTLVGAALWFRRRTDIHKRLMLLATLGVLTPAVARLPIDALRQIGLPAFFGVTIACVLAAVAVDTWRHRRLHPAFGWGAAFIVAMVPLRIAVAKSEPWTAVAGWLVR
jgi:hypothetical protein